jgi:hypothetical protein
MELSESAKQARREYKREWRAKNKDKVAESNRRYWEKQGQNIPAGIPAPATDEQTED